MFACCGVLGIWLILITKINSQLIDYVCPRTNCTEDAKQGSEDHKYGCENDFDCCFPLKCCSTCSHAYKTCVEPLEANVEYLKDKYCPKKQPCPVPIMYNSKYRCNNDVSCSFGYKCCDSQCYLHRVCILPVDLNGIQISPTSEERDFDNTKNYTQPSPMTKSVSAYTNNFPSVPIICPKVRTTSTTTTIPSTIETITPKHTTFTTLPSFTTLVPIKTPVISASTESTHRDQTPSTAPPIVSSQFTNTQTIHEKNLTQQTTSEVPPLTNFTTIANLSITSSSITENTEPVTSSIQLHTPSQNVPYVFDNSTTRSSGKTSEAMDLRPRPPGWIWDVSDIYKTSSVTPIDESASSDGDNKTESHVSVSTTKLFSSGSSSTGPTKIPNNINTENLSTTFANAETDDTEYSGSGDDFSDDEDYTRTTKYGKLTTEQLASSKATYHTRTASAKTHSSHETTTHSLKTTLIEGDGSGDYFTNEDDEDFETSKFITLSSLTNLYNSILPNTSDRTKLAERTTEFGSSPGEMTTIARISSRASAQYTTIKDVGDTHSTPEKTWPGNTEHDSDISISTGIPSYTPVSLNANATRTIAESTSITVDNENGSIQPGLTLTNLDGTTIIQFSSQSIRKPTSSAGNAEFTNESEIRTTEESNSNFSRKKYSSSSAPNGHNQGNSTAAYANGGTRLGESSMTTALTLHATGSTQSPAMVKSIVDPDEAITQSSSTINHKTTTASQMNTKNQSDNFTKLAKTYEIRYTTSSKDWNTKSQQAHLFAYEKESDSNSTATPDTASRTTKFATRLHQRTTAAPKQDEQRQVDNSSTENIKDLTDNSATSSEESRSKKQSSSFYSTTNKHVDVSPSEEATDYMSTYASSHDAGIPRTVSTVTSNNFTKSTTTRSVSRVQHRSTVTTTRSAEKKDGNSSILDNTNMHGYSTPSSIESSSTGNNKKHSSSSTANKEPSVSTSKEESYHKSDQRSSTIYPPLHDNGISKTASTINLEKFSNTTTKSASRLQQRTTAAMPRNMEEKIGNFTTTDKKELTDGSDTFLEGQASEGNKTEQLLISHGTNNKQAGVSISKQENDSKSAHSYDTKYQSPDGSFTRSVSSVTRNGISRATITRSTSKSQHRTTVASPRTKETKEKTPLADDAASVSERSSEESGTRQQMHKHSFNDSTESKHEGASTSNKESDSKSQYGDITKYQSSPVNHKDVNHKETTAKSPQHRTTLEMQSSLRNKEKEVDNSSTMKKTELIDESSSISEQLSAKETGQVLDNSSTMNKTHVGHDTAASSKETRTKENKKSHSSVSSSSENKLVGVSTSIDGSDSMLANSDSSNYQSSTDAGNTRTASTVNRKDNSKEATTKSASTFKHRTTAASPLNKHSKVYNSSTIEKTTLTGGSATSSEMSSEDSNTREHQEKHSSNYFPESKHKGVSTSNKEQDSKSHDGDITKYQSLPIVGIIAGTSPVPLSPANGGSNASTAMSASTSSQHRTTTASPRNKEREVDNSSTIEKTEFVDESSSISEQVSAKVTGKIHDYSSLMKKTNLNHDSATSSDKTRTKENKKSPSSESSSSENKLESVFTSVHGSDSKTANSDSRNYQSLADSGNTRTASTVNRKDISKEATTKSAYTFFHRTTAASPLNKHSIIDNSSTMDNTTLTGGLTTSSEIFSEGSSTQEQQEKHSSNYSTESKHKGTSTSIKEHESKSPHGGITKYQSSPIVGIIAGTFPVNRNDVSKATNAKSASTSSQHRTTTASPRNKEIEVDHSSTMEKTDLVDESSSISEQLSAKETGKILDNSSTIKQTNLNHESATSSDKTRTKEINKSRSSESSSSENKLEGVITSVDVGDSKLDHSDSRKYKSSTDAGNTRTASTVNRKDISKETTTKSAPTFKHRTTAESPLNLQSKADNSSTIDKTALTNGSATSMQRSSEESNTQDPKKKQSSSYTTESKHEGISTSNKESDSKSHHGDIMKYQSSTDSGITINVSTANRDVISKMTTTKFASTSQHRTTTAFSRNKENKVDRSSPNGKTGHTDDLTSSKESSYEGGNKKYSSSSSTTEDKYVGQESISEEEIDPKLVNRGSTKYEAAPDADITRASSTRMRDNFSKASTAKSASTSRHITSAAIPRTKEKASYSSPTIETTHLTDNDSSTSSEQLRSKMTKNKHSLSSAATENKHSGVSTSEEESYSKSDHSGGTQYQASPDTRITETVNRAGISKATSTKSATNAQQRTTATFTRPTEKNVENSPIIEKTGLKHDSATSSEETIAKENKQIHTSSSTATESKDVSTADERADSESEHRSSTISPSAQGARITIAASSVNQDDIIKTTTIESTSRSQRITTAASPRYRTTKFDNSFTVIDKTDLSDYTSNSLKGSSSKFNKEKHSSSSQNKESVVSTILEESDSTSDGKSVSKNTLTDDNYSPIDNNKLSKGPSSSSTKKLSLSTNKTKQSFSSSAAQNKAVRASTSSEESESKSDIRNNTKDPFVRGKEMPGLDPAGSENAILKATSSNLVSNVYQRTTASLGRNKENTDDSLSTNEITKLGEYPKFTSNEPTAKTGKKKHYSSSSTNENKDEQVSTLEEQINSETDIIRNTKDVSAGGNDILESDLRKDPHDVVKATTSISLTSVYHKTTARFSSNKETNDDNFSTGDNNKMIDSSSTTSEEASSKSNKKKNSSSASNSESNDRSNFNETLVKGKPSTLNDSNKQNMDSVSSSAFNQPSSSSSDNKKPPISDSEKEIVSKSPNSDKYNESFPNGNESLGPNLKEDTDDSITTTSKPVSSLRHKTTAVMGRHKEGEGTNFSLEDKNRISEDSNFTSEEANSKSSNKKHSSSSSTSEHREAKLSTSEEENNLKSDIRDQKTDTDRASESTTGKLVTSMRHKTTASLPRNKEREDDNHSNETHDTVSSSQDSSSKSSKNNLSNYSSSSESKKDSISSSEEEAISNSVSRSSLLYSSVGSNDVLMTSSPENTTRKSLPSYRHKPTEASLSIKDGQMDNSKYSKSASSTENPNITTYTKESTLESHNKNYLSSSMTTGAQKQVLKSEEAKSAPTSVSDSKNLSFSDNRSEPNKVGKTTTDDTKSTIVNPVTLHNAQFPSAIVKDNHNKETTIQSSLKLDHTNNTYSSVSSSESPNLIHNTVNIQHKEDSENEDISLNETDPPSLDIHDGSDGVHLQEDGDNEENQDEDEEDEENDDDDYDYDNSKEGDDVDEEIRKNFDKPLPKNDKLS